MTEKILGATYTVTVDSPEFMIGSKVVLCYDDDTDMPAFSPKDQYAPYKDLTEMDWQYFDMQEVSLDEDPESLDEDIDEYIESLYEDPQVGLCKPFKINVNGIKVTVPSSTTTITINSKTNAIEISWEEF